MTSFLPILPPPPTHYLFFCLLLFLSFFLSHFLDLCKYLIGSAISSSPDGPTQFFFTHILSSHISRTNYAQNRSFYLLSPPFCPRNICLSVPFNPRRLTKRKWIEILFQTWRKALWQVFLGRRNTKICRSLSKTYHIIYVGWMMPSSPIVVVALLCFLAKEVQNIEVGHNFRPKPGLRPGCSPVRLCTQHAHSSTAHCGRFVIFAFFQNVSTVSTLLSSET